MTTELGESQTTWYQATQIEAPPRPRLTFDLDVDVCVVGAGLAGLTVAREVARRGWSVAVLEGERTGWAASSLNAGFVLPGFSQGIDDIIERIGLDHAKQLWSLSQRGVDYVRATIADSGMPGVEAGEGWLHVSKTDTGRRTQEFVERLRWLGADAAAWSTEQVRAVLPSERYFSAVYHPRALHIHPLNYVTGLAALGEAAGARIYEETPAISIDAAGIRKRVQTPSALVRANHVVLAGNVHLGTLMPRLAATLMPLTTYVLVTEPLGAALHDAVKFHGAVSDGDRAGNHYRIVGGERLMWSGHITAKDAAPHRFARSLIRGMQRIYPQLADAKPAYVWSGALGRTLHRMPQIGEIQSGLWVASGFSGHGLNNTAVAGELIARGIVENDDTWRLFAPYELVWAGGRAGRAAVIAVNHARRPFHAARESLARYRERRRTRHNGRTTAATAGAADSEPAV